MFKSVYFNRMIVICLKIWFLKAWCHSNICSKGVITKTITPSYDKSYITYYAIQYWSPLLYLLISLLCFSKYTTKASPYNNFANLFYFSTSSQLLHFLRCIQTCCPTIIEYWIIYRRHQKIKLVAIDLSIKTHLAEHRST